MSDWRDLRPYTIHAACRSIVDRHHGIRWFVGDRRPIVMAHPSLAWSCTPVSYKDWPWVIGSALSGGLYSRYERRFIPFHRDDEWYQVAVRPDHLIPYITKSVPRHLKLGEDQ